MSRYHQNWGVTGHEWAIQHLARSLNAGRLRHAYLFTGPAGVGKTTLALAMAMAVNCIDDHARPCGVCRPCTLIAREKHADVSILRADEGALKIEQVRNMVQTLSLRPVEARFRVVILRRFNEATPQAMDALLKTLEEPPPYVLLLITTDSADGLLPTIRSRCQPLNLRPITPMQVREALIFNHNVDPEDAALLAQLSGGRMGWAIRAVTDGDMQSRRTDWLRQLEDALDQDRVKRFALAENLSSTKNRSDLPEVLELWLSYWRDALLLSSHASTPIVNRDRRHSLDQIARALSADQALNVLQAVRRTARMLDQNVNARLAMEVLMLDLPQLRLYQAPPG